MYIFVGNEVKPAFMLEIDKKRVKVYTPDKYSIKEEDFIEKYCLGKIVLEANKANIIFIKDIPKKYGKAGYNSQYVSELILKTEKDYLFINKIIKKLKYI